MSSHNGEELSVEHFRHTLQSVTKDLTRLCERWSEYLNNEIDEPNAEPEHEEHLGAIRSTIGQAKLLMSQRFKQFNDLIDHCEFKTGHQPTRLNDLSGFWEMISFQVDDVKQKFKSLEM